MSLILSLLSSGHGPPIHPGVVQHQRDVLLTSASSPAADAGRAKTAAERITAAIAKNKNSLKFFITNLLLSFLI
jgi:hypothetical protein